MNTKWILSCYLYPLLIFIVGLAVYGNAINNDFVWLDSTYVLSLGNVHNIQISQLFQGSILTGTGYYRPFNAIYYVVMYALFQNNAAYYHLFQIIIHCTNAFLIFVIFRKFFQKITAFILSILFLVHPIIESNAAFISNSADTLYLFFGLLAFLSTLYVKHILKRNILAAIFILCSLFFKESGILFVILILTSEFLTRKKIFFTSFCYLSISFLFYVGFRYFMQGFTFYQSGINPIMRLTFEERLLNIPSVILFYIQYLFIPYRIGVNHNWVYTNVNFKHFFLPLSIDCLFLVAIAFCGIWLYKKQQNSFSIFLLFSIPFFVSFISIIQLIPLDLTVAPRWFYFPLFCFLGMIGTVVKQFMQNDHRKHMSILLMLIAIFAFVYFSIRTIIRNTYWHDNLTLFTYAASIDDNFITEEWLSYAYVNKGDYATALKHIRISVNKFPYDGNIIGNAIIHERLGDNDSAQKLYLLAERSKSYAPKVHDENTYQLLIQHYQKIKDYAHTKKLTIEAIHTYPNNAYFWTILATIDYKENNITKSLYDIQKAHTLDSSDPSIQKYYQIILTSQN